MHSRLKVAALLAVVPILALSPAAFPSKPEPGCARSAPGARYNQRWFMSLMRRNDERAKKTLAAYAVKRTLAVNVRPVTNEAVCVRAAEAYSRAIHQSSAGRKVHVLRVGDSFIVSDPEYTFGGYRRAVTFDSRFKRVLAHVNELAPQGAKKRTMFAWTRW